jgi:hypothetical protein
VKERLTTLACAVGALLLFGAMFLRGEARLAPAGEPPRPTSAERRADGHYAAFEWLRSERIPAHSWRDRYERLLDGEQLPAPAGNLLVLTLPASVGIRSEEFLSLASWVRAGNTLLVLAALSDRPAWANTPAGLTAADLSLLTGLEFETSSPREATTGLRTFAEPRRAVLVPNRSHAYFEGVQSAVALSDAPAPTWAVKVPYDGFVLALARERSSGDEVFWTRPLGEGLIIVSGFSSVFTNRAIGDADNARLLANIVAANLGEGGTVLFDDLHQGLGGAYDPQQFYSDRRLYVSAAILVALWLVWVLGSTRLRTPVTRIPAPREAELVEASGSFFARVLSSDAAARALIEHFFARTRERASLPQRDEPPWAYLERHPRVAAADIAHLKSWHAAAMALRRIPLIRLQNVLARIERHTT